MQKPVLIPRVIPYELLEIFDPLVKQGRLRITCRPTHFEIRKDRAKEQYKKES